MKLSKPERKFVVLSSQRSGTTWLMSLLGQVEPTRAYGELFLTRKKAGAEERWDDEVSYPRFPEAYATGGGPRVKQVFSYLDQLYSQPGAVGFKLMYTQVQKYPEILLYLVVRRIRIVHLVRRNQLDVLISRAIKNKIRRAHVLSQDSLPVDVQVKIDPEKLLVRLRRRTNKVKNARRLLRLSTLPILEVTYEDLLSDKQTFPQLCRFLGIDSGDQMPESKLLKTGGRKQAEVVSNYPEIRRALTGTNFAGWMDQPDEINGG